MEMNPMVNPIKTDSISVFDLFMVVFTKKYDELAYNLLMAKKMIANFNIYPLATLVWI